MALLDKHTNTVGDKAVTMDNALNSTVTPAEGYRAAETASPWRRILASCATLAIAMGLCLSLLVIAWAAMLLLPAQ